MDNRHDTRFEVWCSGGKKILYRDAKNKRGILHGASQAASSHCNLQQNRGRQYVVSVYMLYQLLDVINRTSQNCSNSCYGFLIYRPEYDWLTKQNTFSEKTCSLFLLTVTNWRMAMLRLKQLNGQDVRKHSTTHYIMRLVNQLRNEMYATKASI